MCCDTQYLMHVLPLCWIWDIFTNVVSICLKNLSCFFYFFQTSSEQECSLRSIVPSKAFTVCSAVNTCEYLKVNQGEIAAEIFDLTITVSSFYRDSSLGTIFSATQLAQSHNKSFAGVSHLLCKMASQDMEFCSVTVRYEERITCLSFKKEIGIIDCIFGVKGI